MPTARPPEPCATGGGAGVDLPRGFETPPGIQPHWIFPDAREAGAAGAGRAELFRPGARVTLGKPFPGLLLTGNRPIRKAMSLARLIRGQLAANHRIAVSVLDVLAESGEAALRARAVRALGDEAPAIHQVGRWIAPKRLIAMLEAGALSRNRARRVGQKLVSPGGVGLALCYGGLATPEKAYRRVDDLLARETGTGRYATLSITGESARIAFEPAAQGTDPRDTWPAELGPAVCGMREGMFEAIPMLFGLLPGKARETQCAFQGADRCEFEVRWSRMPRLGVAAGAGGGMARGSARGGTHRPAAAVRPRARRG